MLRSRTFSFDDPQQYGPAIRAAQIEMFPTAGGTFRTELVQCDLGSVWMQRMVENKARISHGAVDGARTILEFLTDTRQHSIKHSGIESPPGDIVVNASTTAHRRTFGASRFGTVSLRNEELKALAYAMLGYELNSGTTTYSYRPDQTQLKGLLRWHQAAARLARRSPETLEHSEIARALEHSLSRAMVMCLADQSEAERRQVKPRHSWVVARLEELLAKHHDRPLHLAEICAATAISERTLRLFCNEFLGMGPIRYLWLRRMHLARRALLREFPVSSTVSRVASDFGFWEFGRFSVQYRNLFGESPSATLHRGPIAAVVRGGQPILLPGLA